jgi:hypothetical protein
MYGVIKEYGMKLKSNLDYGSSDSEQVKGKRVEVTDFEDATGEYAQANIFDISNTLTEVTMCFWIKSEDLTYGNGVSLGTVGLNGFMVRHRPDGYLQSYMVSDGSNNDWINSDTTVSAGDWHFVCGLWNSTKANLWWDGSFTTNSNTRTGAGGNPADRDWETVVSEFIQSLLLP